jgi:LysM repeat protein
MRSLNSRLLSGTFLPVLVGMGVALTAGGSLGVWAQSENPCAAKKPIAGSKAAANPCAAGSPCNPCAAGDRTYTIRAGDSLASVAQQTYGDRNLYRMLADYNGITDPNLILVGQVIRIPTNPCAARNVAAAANPCHPCNPCAAANPCNPCNPCAAKGMAGASECVVPRLQIAAAQNPCAAKNPCNPCNPCAPAEVVELTPAEASAAYECIKGVMKAAYTGQLQQAAAGPCNPCAAKSPCNPRAANPCAAAANPCNPCAAKNPCAANPCNPCAATNPCKPDAAAVLDEVAVVARNYQGWTRLNTTPYVSATHGSRYVNNYPGPEAAQAYGEFEEIGAMPAGGRIAKDSFTVTPDGRVGVGPLFVMEKMAEGFNAASDDWRYAMIMPDGSLFGVTNGQGSQNVQFCAECHALVADDQDSLYFLPEEVRETSG